MPTKKRSYNLPDGGYTQNVDEYIRAWKRVAIPIEWQNGIPNMPSNWSTMSAASKRNHIVRQRERRKEKLALGHCRDCRAKTIFSSGRCKPCYKTFAKSAVPIARRWRRKKIAEGFCSTCCRRKATKGFKSCAVCRKKARAMWKICPRKR